jgi:hypothetical protein
MASRSYNKIIYPSAHIASTHYSLKKSSGRVVPYKLNVRSLIIQIPNFQKAFKIVFSDHI